MANLPVKQIEDFSHEVDKEQIHLLIGTPEEIYVEIIKQLEKYGFHHHKCMDSRRESVLIERCFSKMWKFLSLYNPPVGEIKAALEMFREKVLHRQVIEKYL